MLVILNMNDTGSQSLLELWDGHKLDDLPLIKLLCTGQMNGQERKNEKKTLERIPGNLCDGASLSLTYQDLLEEVLVVAQAIEIGQFPGVGWVRIGEQG